MADFFDKINQKVVEAWMAHYGVSTPDEAIAAKRADNEAQRPSLRHTRAPQTSSRVKCVGCGITFTAGPQSSLCWQCSVRQNAALAKAAAKQQKPIVVAHQVRSSVRLTCPHCLQDYYSDSSNPPIMCGQCAAWKIRDPSAFAPDDAPEEPERPVEVKNQRGANKPAFQRLVNRRKNDAP